MTRVMLSFGLIMGLASGALAAGELHGACKDDVAKVCKGVKPGQGRIWACLSGATDKVSPACKDAIVAKQATAKQFHDDCQADVESQCKKVAAGKGRRIACLRGAKDKLSAACRAHFEKNTVPDEKTEK